MEHLRMKKEDISTAIIKLINKIDHYRNNADSEFHKILLTIQNQFDNCRRKLASEKYFVACFGALKAGKSTLINALAEQKVSPAGAGETTLRCSIILCADENNKEGITLYRRIDKKWEESQDEKDVQEKLEQHINQLFSYFQGVIKKEEIEKSFEYKFYPIDKLEYILTDKNLSDLQQFRNFDIAEIRINTNGDDNILKENVALIDMPGIDGALAGIAKNKLLNFIPLHCHHLLWVQSNMSAINETTYARLDKFSNEKSSTPIYSILNVIKGKGEWLSAEAENKEIDRAATEIMYKFNDNLFQVNAAMAWAACDFENIKTDLKVTQDYLYENSKIKDLKNALLNRINTSSKKTILLDALTEIENVYKNLNEKDSNVQEYLRKMEEKKFQDEDEIERLTNYSNNLDDIYKCGDSKEDEGRRNKFVSELRSEYWDKKKNDSANINDFWQKIQEIKLPNIHKINDANKEEQKNCIDNAIKNIDKEIDIIRIDFTIKIKDPGIAKLNEILTLANDANMKKFFDGLPIDEDIDKKIRDLKIIPKMEDFEYIKNNKYSVRGFSLSRLWGHRNWKEITTHIHDTLWKHYTDSVTTKTNDNLNAFAKEIDNLYNEYREEFIKAEKEKTKKRIEDLKVSTKKIEDSQENINDILSKWKKICDDAEKYKQELNN